MNVIFFLLFCICAIVFLFLSPERFLSTLLGGASKSATLCIAMLAGHTVWMGLMNVWEDSGISRALSKRLRPLAAKIFKTNHADALDAVCMNLSVNLLGISGAATPYGIRAAALLDKTDHAEYASSLFFLLNAGSIQLFPASLVAMRTSLSSVSPTDIVLPLLLSSLFSTALAIVLLCLCRALYRSRVFRARSATFRQSKEARLS